MTFLRELAHLDINFIQWMKVGFPAVIILLLKSWLGERPSTERTKIVLGHYNAIVVIKWLYIVKMYGHFF